MRIKGRFLPLPSMKPLITEPDMNLFASTRTQRRIAFAVLLVWLFAVASGVANACMLQASDGSPAPGVHAHRAMAASAALAASAASAASGDPTAVSAGHFEAGDGHDDDTRAAAPLCLKVCDEGSTAVLKLQAPVDLSDPGMAPLVAVVWNPAAPAALGPRWRVAEQPLPAGPPVRDRYCRLAL